MEHQDAEEAERWSEKLNDPLPGQSRSRNWDDDEEDRLLREL